MTLNFNSTHTETKSIQATTHCPPTNLITTQLARTTNQVQLTNHSQLRSNSIQEKTPDVSRPKYWPALHFNSTFRTDTRPPVEFVFQLNIRRDNSCAAAIISFSSFKLKAYKHNKHPPENYRVIFATSILNQNA